MRPIIQYLVLVALAGHAAAGTLNFTKKLVEKRGNDSVAARLDNIGISTPGTNSMSANGAAWLGNDGPYINDFHNDSGEDIILVIWGPNLSWVNAHAPLITVSIPNNGAETVSFANGASGGWASIYSDTELTPYGQIDQTWGEYTFNGQWSTFDVSREVNMNGRPMSISTPNCTSDFARCVFRCLSGVNTCTDDYELYNCAAGSQPGAQIGYINGAPTGGCSGMGDSARLTTIFS